MFSAKDRMDFRYFHKRSHYLAVIAQSLQKPIRDTKGPMSGLEVEWSCTGGDTRRPCIAIRAGKGKHWTSIVLIFRARSKKGNRNQNTCWNHQLIIPFFLPSSIEVSPSPCRFEWGAIFQLQLFDHARLAAQVRSTLSPSTVLDIVARKRVGIVFGTMANLGVKKGNQQREGRKRMVCWNAGRMGCRRWRTRREGRGSWELEESRWTGQRAGRMAIAASGFGIRWQVGGVFMGQGLTAAHTDFNKSPVFLGRTSEARVRFTKTAVADDRSLPPNSYLRSRMYWWTQPEASISCMASKTVICRWYVALSLSIRTDVQLQSHASETLAMLEDSSVDRFAEVFLKDQSLGPHAFDEFIQSVPQLGFAPS